MFDLDKWNEIWSAITQNKSRSVMTAFGIFWGMLMLVIMVGAGKGLENGIFSQIEGFASNSCFFSTGMTSEAYKGFRKGRQLHMTLADMNALLAQTPEIEYYSPIQFMSNRQNNVVYGEKYGTYNVKGVFPDYWKYGTYNVKGVFPDYNKIEKVKLIYGRYINEIDMMEKRKVCIIGERVNEVLFGKGYNPCGELIKVENIYFRIIGVAQGIGAGVNLGGRAEESVILPFNTMQQAFQMGSNIPFLCLTAAPNVKVKELEETTKAFLKRQLIVSPTDEKAIWSMNLEEQINLFVYLTLGISIMIWIVGSGSLLAGGIGVSNIMLVTIKERTKEIGIRRAIGAKPINIISQILAESIILTSIAGLMGLMLGLFIIQGVNIGLEQGDQFFKGLDVSFGVAVGGLCLLTVIGLLAGLIPAARAIKIKPIEAIREE